MPVPTLSERVAGNVRAEMARRRVTQKALADALGQSQAFVSRRLKGGVPFDASELQRVAEALAVPVEALLSEPTEVAS